MSEKPLNVVWINSDHYAYMHHFELNRRLIRTPAYDRLCAEGTRFDNAYTVCPLCTPARASLVTGQYPHTHGIVNNDGSKLDSREAFLPDAPIYANELRKLGIRPALIGKWHAVAGGPGTAQDVGFDGWTLRGYGHPYDTDVYRSYLAECGLPETPEVNIEWHKTNQGKLGRIPLKATGGKAAGVSYHAATGIIEAPVETHEAYFVAHQAKKYLEERAKDGESFCLRVDPWGPHQPYFVAEPFAGTVNPSSIAPYPNFAHDLSDRPSHHRDFHAQITDKSYAKTWDEWRPIMARCYEHIALVDTALNGILDTLDQLGLSNNTVVIYSADHGDILTAHGGCFDKGWLMVEETMRIPLVVRWPGTQPGAIRDELVSNLDIVATLRDIAGAAPGASAGGTSLRPLAQAAIGASVPWRDDLMLESHGHYERKVFQRMLRWKNWKYVAHLDDRDELYDLVRDPYEIRNRDDDPAAASVLKDMRHRLARHMDKTGDKSPDALRLLAQMMEA